MSLGHRCPGVSVSQRHWHSEYRCPRTATQWYCVPSSAGKSDTSTQEDYCGLRQPKRCLSPSARRSQNARRNSWNQPSRAEHKAGAMSRSLTCPNRLLQSPRVQRSRASGVQVSGSPVSRCPGVTIRGVVAAMFASLELRLKAPA